MLLFVFFFSFFFHDTATTEIYTLSLHDALPISQREIVGIRLQDRLATEHDRGLRQLALDGLLALRGRCGSRHDQRQRIGGDRKSTRLNSSHANISYAVFCLKKKKKKKKTETDTK